MYNTGLYLPKYLRVALAVLVIVFFPISYFAISHLFAIDDEVRNYEYRDSSVEHICELLPRLNADFCDIGGVQNANTLEDAIAHAYPILETTYHDIVPQLATVISGSSKCETSLDDNNIPTYSRNNCPSPSLCELEYRCHFNIASDLIMGMTFNDGQVISYKASRLD